MEKDTALRNLYRIWMRIINKLNESEKIPRDFGIDELITPSDIHILQVIGNNPESNVRTIADIIGVTPGAASQQLTKLSRRGLVIKVRGMKNEKEVHLNLTSQGRVAYENHEIIHEKVYIRIINRIGSLTPEEITLLERVLKAVESVYDERIDEVRKSLSIYEDSKSTQKFKEINS